MGRNHCLLLASCFAFFASSAVAVPIKTAPSGDANRSGTVTTADLQCLLRVVVVWGEFDGSNGVLHPCTAGSATEGASCSNPTNGKCRRGPSGQLFCAPSCISAEEFLEKPPNLCGSGIEASPVDPAAICHGHVPLRLLDLNCDGALGSADLSFMSDILLLTPPDLDGDGALNHCDPDSDGDGALDVGDCRSLDPTVYPGAPELCDNQFNGCPPGGDIDFPPDESDPACALRYGPLVYGYAPEVLTPSVQMLLVGAFLDATSTVVTLNGVVLGSLVTSSTQMSVQINADVAPGEYTLTVTTPTGSMSIPVVVAGIPTISTIQPTDPTSGGTMTVVGGNLIGADVFICGVEARVVDDGTTSIVIEVDPYTPSGDCLVEIVTPLGSASQQIGVQTGGPFVAYATPNPVLTGELLEIIGTNLEGTSVQIGGLEVTVIVADDGRIVVEVPAGLAQGDTEIVVTNAAGSGSYTVYVTPVPLAPPTVFSIEPEPIPLGGTILVRGNWLIGGTVTLGGQPQSVLSGNNTELEVYITPGGAVGQLGLTVTTLLGSYTYLVTVVGTPVVTSTLPNPAVLGQSLTVVGKYLGNFTSVTLGGVNQVFFPEITETQLVFVVSPTTPIGTQDLVITTPGGSVTVSVAVAPANPAAPEILDIAPSSAKPGDTITISGKALSGVTWTIGGVEHIALASANDLLVDIVLRDDVPHGDQPLVADKAQYGSASGSVFVILGPPRVSLMRTSAVNANGYVGLAFLPGAVASGAVIDIGINGSFHSIQAAADGSAGTLIDGIVVDTEISVAQGVPGNISDPAVITLTTAEPSAPQAPHPYLVRVELRDDGEVEVFGAAPAFGESTDRVFVVGAEALGTALASDLYETPGAGVLVDAGGAPVIGVFSVGSSASPVMVTTPVPLDLPAISSSPQIGRVCLASLSGSIPDNAGFTLDLIATTATGTDVPTSQPVVAVGEGGTLFVTADVTQAGAAVASIEWSGELEGQGFQVSTTDGVLPLTLSAADVSATSANGVTTVTLAANQAGRLFIVGSPTGDVFVGETGVGTTSVVLPGTPSEVYAFLFDKDADSTSPCRAVPVGP